jgi:hypothetical protein
LNAPYERDVAVDVRTPDDLADVLERQPLSGDEKRLH